MLVDYEKEQSNSYLVVKNAVLNDKLSHAYLIDANGYQHAFEFALSFAKFIFCNYHYEQYNPVLCGSCHICSLVDNRSFPEIKIIEPDGLFIKKEQLLELQSEFNLSCVNGKYRVYIIKDCEKMNKSASNCLLKFLEEPVPGIVAILLTNHLSNLLSTVVSRCQILHFENSKFSFNHGVMENFSLLFSNSDEEKEKFLSDEKNFLILKEILEFADYYEENGIDFLIYVKQRWKNVLLSRENTLMAFSFLIYLYYDAFKYKISLDEGEFFFNDYVDNISKISSQNSLEKLIYKLEVFQYGYNMLKNNLNINLLVDDVVIKLGEKNEYSRS